MYHNQELNIQKVIPRFIIDDNEYKSPEPHLNKSKIRFCELEIGDEFDYYGELLTKQNRYNAISVRNRNKKQYLFFVACKGYKTIFSFCDTNKDLYVKNYERFIYTFKNIRCTSFQLSFWCKLINDEIVDIMEESIECTCEYIKNDKDDMEKQVMGGQFFK